MIINVSSGGGIYGVPAMSIYSASKFALEGFSEAVSYELESQNIVVKLIEPHGGVTATNFNARVAEDSGDVRAVADYDQFKADMREAYRRTAAASRISSRDVALEIYKAATDGSRRLRYLIGVDSRGFLNAKQTLPDQESLEFMRSYFRSGEGASDGCEHTDGRCCPRSVRRAVTRPGLVTIDAAASCNSCRACGIPAAMPTCQDQSALSLSLPLVRTTKYLRQKNNLKACAKTILSNERAQGLKPRSLMGLYGPT